MTKPNILHGYASFNNIFTFSCLSRDEVAVPGETYQASGPSSIIFRSGGGGNPEFFVDNIEVEALVAPNGSSRVSTVATIMFTVQEPYSMGGFLKRCQEEAISNGYKNYIDAPYLLSWEAVGWGDSGDALVTGGGSPPKRNFQLKLTNITFEVNNAGTVYQVEAIPWNEQSFTDQVQNTNSDIAIKGKTIQELLQTGEQSLTTIINGRLEELKQEQKLLEADEIVITFPKEISSDFNPPSGLSNTDAGATTSSGGGGGGLFGNVVKGAVGGIIGGALSGNKNVGQAALGGAIGGALGGFGGGLLGGAGIGGLLTNFKNGNKQGLFEGINGVLGSQAPQNFESFLSMITGQVMTKSSIGENLSSIAQSSDSLNDIGKSKIIDTFTEQGQSPMEQTGQIYDKKNKVFTRGKNVISPDERVFNFKEGTKITRMIEEVILTSQWAKELKERAPDANGMVPWFRIDAETYLKTNPSHESVYGHDAKVHHYKVTLYMVHTSHFQNPQEGGPGYESLKANAVKEYNYIYSGENLDIIKFDIQFNAAFFQFLQADYGQGDVEYKTGATQNRAVKEDKEPLKLDVAGGGSISAAGSTTQVPNLSSSSMGSGGAAIDNSKIRWARQFHDNILGSGSMDLVNVKLEIFGDPYFFFDSGMGNWTDGPGSLNETASGQMEYQRSECDIILNFRSPTDYNDATGGMEFSTLQEFSGLYRVVRVTSMFRNNQFSQELQLLRRRNQDTDTGGAGGGNPNKAIDAPKPTWMPSPFKD